MAAGRHSTGAPVGMGTWGLVPTELVLVAILTISQPGGADYAHLMSPPSFESHRRACSTETRNAPLPSGIHQVTPIDSINN